MTRIPDSLRFLSGKDIGSASVAFSPDGKFLLVTERTTNSIDVFSVLPNGTLSAITVNQNVGAGTFAVAFDRDAFVSETGTGGNTSANSSYSVQPNGTLLPISSSVPTLGAANCWDAVTPDGRFVYASNSAGSSIAGFAVGNTGALTALPGTVLALNPSGSANSGPCRPSGGVSVCQGLIQRR